MARKDLTDKELIKLTKKPPEKKTYIREGNGFAIRIMPTGSITFLHIYTIGGSRKEDNLGHYPHIVVARKVQRLGAIVRSLTANKRGSYKKLYPYKLAA